MNVIKSISFYLLLLLVLGGCKEEESDNGRGGIGSLAVEFLTDKSLQTRIDAPVYKLEIKKMNGDLVSSYEDCSSITGRILLPSGDYKLIATNGKDTVVGFETPFYKNEQDIKIEAAVTKEISMICTQANVKVSVKFSEKIQNNFSEYALEVTNDLGKLVFQKNEARAGFLKVNNGTIVWNLTLDNGQEVYHINKTITDVQPRQYYQFSFDIKETGDENEGAFVPGITVDTTTDVFNWVCDVVLKESIAKPEIKREDGNTLKEPVLILDEARGANAKVEITSLAQIQDLKIRHNSTTVKELGIPETVTLTNITPELKNIVNNAGILWGNESLLDAQNVLIDFSPLANSLPLGDYEFYIQVYDARCRLVTDTLRLKIIPDVDHVALNPVRYEIWAKFATVSGIWYTTDRPEEMGIEYSSDQIDWTRVDAGKLTFDDKHKSFSALLVGLTPDKTYYYRTVSAGLTSSDVKSFTTESAVVVPYLNFDTWFKAGKNGAGSGKNWYLGESGNKVWDSGNEGANTMSEKNPTAPDYSNKVDIPGNEASAYLETKVVFGVMAAGNIYTGDFKEAIVNLSNPGAKLDFGIPYNGRPTSFSGYYKYQPVGVTQTSRANVAKGDLDSCHIYVALFADWTAAFPVNTQEAHFVDLSTAIAFGEVKASKVMQEFEHFSVNIKYRDKTKIPTYVLIVATASKYGDYFTGGEGSKLWLDEFELGFDPVEE